MIRLLYLVLLSLNIAVSFGQDVTFELSKDVIKSDEEFAVEFTVLVPIDSANHPEFEDFELLGQPRIFRSTVTIMGETKNTVDVKYELKPKKVGVLKIPVPMIYSKGKIIKSKAPKVTVLDEGLNKDELLEIEFKEFTKGYGEPDGAVKIVFIDGMGYLAKREDRDWNIIRKLTKEEIKSLHGMYNN